MSRYVQGSYPDFAEVQETLSKHRLPSGLDYAMEHTIPHNSVRTGSFVRKPAVLEPWESSEPEFNSHTSYVSIADPTLFKGDGCAVRAVKALSPELASLPFHTPSLAHSQCAANPELRLTKEQHDVLEGQFKNNGELSNSTKRNLAQSLGISVTLINDWIQNRRVKVKSELYEAINGDVPLGADLAQQIHSSQMLNLPETKQNLGPKDELGSSDGDIYPRLLPAHIDDPHTTAYVPDWSFVQRRYELPHLPRSNDCPSMTTGSTISSRNSSTRSSKSFRLEGVEPSGKGTCPIPECGRVFRDLNTHMLTHQAERPEKCPVETCEYHVKGFARPHDRDRHTMTHFSGPMFCGFCPSPEKAFCRSDVFMRHLSNVHGAKEIDRPNAILQLRRPSESLHVATCTLCAEPFDAQGFHKHLPGCIIRQVTNEWRRPQAEQNNEKRQIEVRILKSKGSPRNDCVVTPVDDLSPIPLYCLGESQPSELDALHTRPEERTTHEISDPEPESKEIEELTASSRCLSLTSSNGDPIKSSDEETDWTEDVGSPFSEPDATGVPPMLSPIKRQLVNSIMREFHRLFDKSLRTAHGGSSSNAGYGPYGSSSSGSSTYSSSSFISRKRSLSGGSTPPPNDNGDDANKRRRPDPKSRSGKQAMPELRFACPYYKRNPGRHQTFTSCRDPGFITVARLKEHLYRRHLLPIQCNRCCTTFPNEPTLREHQRDRNGCEVREQIPLEGFDKDQERKLKSKKRSLVYQSEEDKWKGVYRILFPDDNENEMPSPYIEYQSCTTGPTGESTNIVRFHEFSRLELPRLVRRTLEVAVEEEAQPLEEKLKERLVDIVRECQTQLISLFQSTGAGGGQNVNPPELGPVLASIPALESETVPLREPEPAQHADTHAPFQNFNSFANTTADYIPIPASHYPEYEVPKPDASAADGNASDSPDSGYDSTYPAAAFSQDPAFPTDMLFGQQTQANYGSHGVFTESDYADLEGYYGLFENRHMRFDTSVASGADTSWAYLDPNHGTGNA